MEKKKKKKLMKCRYRYRYIITQSYLIVEGIEQLQRAKIWKFQKLATERNFLS